MMKKNQHTSSTLKINSSTLTRSRTYIVVPRDVPPENFISVSETRKVRKVGICRCLLPPLGIGLVILILLAGTGYLLYRYNVAVTEWPGALKSLRGEGTSLGDCNDPEWACCDPRVKRNEPILEGCNCSSIACGENKYWRSDSLEVMVEDAAEARDQSSLPDKQGKCPSSYWVERPHTSSEEGVICTPCLCSKQGSISQDCHQSTGQCSCRPGYTGHKCNICSAGYPEKQGGCEVSPLGEPGAILPACESSPCLAGGTCEEHDGTFTCYCKEHRSGKYCEKTTSSNLTVAGFGSGSADGPSYVELRPLPSTPTRTDIAVTFRSFASTGLLVYSESEPGPEGVRQSLLLGIEDRHIIFEFRLDLNDEEGNSHLRLRYPIPIELGTWHSVRARRYHQDGILSLDSLEPLTGRAPGTEKHLNLTGSTWIADAPFHHYQLTPLDGCIRELEFDHVLVNLLAGRRGEPLILNSVGLLECDTHPCSDKLASDGCADAAGCRLEAGSDPHEGVVAQCECRQGTTGPDCQEVDRQQDVCRHNPCQGGGTCRASINGQAECVCPDGLYGMLCENTVEEINQHFQHPGAAEVHHGVPGYPQSEEEVPRLLPVRVGPVDDKDEAGMQSDQSKDQQAPPTPSDWMVFDGQTTWSVPNKKNRRQYRIKRSDILLTFKTGAKNGVLLYMGNQNTVGGGDSLEIGVRSGRLVVKCQMVVGEADTAESGIVSTETWSRDRVDNLLWHTLLVRHSGCRLYARLDNSEVMTADRPLAKVNDRGKALNTDGLVWLGGRGSRDISDSAYFLGSMRHLSINGHNVTRPGRSPNQTILGQI